MLIGPAGDMITTPRLYWNVELAVMVVLFISVPFTYRVLVPNDDGFGISVPLFEQVDDAHVMLLYEYEQETAVPKEM